MAPRNVALLAALSAIWGSSYLLIKYALEDFEAPFIVWARTALAALVVLAALGASARPALAHVRRAPGWSAVLGLVSVGLPFILITYGEHTVPSGLTAVLISPASLFVALFAILIDHSERVDRVQAAGMVLGLAGVALVVGVESVSTLGELLGALAMIGAAALYGISGFVVKAHFGGLNAMQTSLISITAASLMTLPPAVATWPDHMPGLRAVVAVIFLGGIGTAAAFVIYYRLLREVGAARASLVSYLSPGIALFYGALLLDERITPLAIAGCAVILAGVAIAARARREPPAPVEPVTGELAVVAGRR
jgi:drug/metabolite transporter (DMT)-like permease